MAKWLKFYFVVLVVLLIVIIGLFLMRSDLSSFLTQEQISLAIKIAIVLFVIIFVKIIMKQASWSMEKRLSKKGGEEEKIFLVRSIFKVFFWIITILIVLGVFMEDWASLLTALGLIGAGLAIALQHPILNFIGWVVIVMSKPLNVGERIEVSHMKGDVFDIGIMYTKIRLLDEFDAPTGKFVTIPNEIILINPVINLTRGSPYIWDAVEFSITYESNIKKAKDIVFKVADSCLEHRKIAKDVKIKRYFTEEQLAEKPAVFMKLADSSIIVKVRYLVHIKDKLSKRSEITEKVYAEISKTKGIDIAYPHMHIVGIGKK
jgi:small-conductance mechanosensitive channel